MAQSRRRRRRSFTFQFRRDGENARARTCVCKRTHARDDRERVTREAIGSSDREYRYTCVHLRGPKLSIGPSCSPSAITTTAFSSLYIEIALRPNRTHAFAFHRRRSPGKSFSSFRLPAPSLINYLSRARFKIQPKSRTLEA